MQIALTVPDELAVGLGENADAVSRLALESLAIEGYRSDRLSAFQVRQMLGHKSCWETEDFLSGHGVWPGLTVEDAKKDSNTLARLIR